MKGGDLPGLHFKTKKTFLVLNLYFFFLELSIYYLDRDVFSISPAFPALPASRAMVLLASLSKLFLGIDSHYRTSPPGSYSTQAPFSWLGRWQWGRTHPPTEFLLSLTWPLKTFHHGYWELNKNLIFRDREFPRRGIYFQKSWIPLHLQIPVCTKWFLRWREFR